LLLFCFLVLDLAVPGLWVLAVGTWFTVGQRTLCVHRALCTPRRTD